MTCLGLAEVSWKNFGRIWKMRVPLIWTHYYSCTLKDGQAANRTHLQEKRL